jgi:hypothetical protein
MKQEQFAEAVVATLAKALENKYAPVTGRTIALDRCTQIQRYLLGLSETDRENVNQLMRSLVSTAAFTFCALLDGSRVSEKRSTSTASAD